MEEVKGVVKKKTSKRTRVRATKKKKPSVAETLAIGKEFREHIKGSRY
jgi:hypothetical protein